jgi:pyridoxal phosphate enzyme (YggS family)
MDAVVVATRIEQVRERIAAAAARAGRDPAEITLVGASKTVDPERIAAAVAAGLRDVGENYVQEAQEKFAHPALRSADLRWHLIGHLQSNKARSAVGLFAIIQTVDSPRLASILARHAVAMDRQLGVLLEVDYTGLPTRSGCRPEALPATVEALLGAASLQVEGLMTVPAPGLAPAETRAVYRQLRCLRDDLAARYPSLAWQQLSMGMTEDFELAIEEGATMVRIGRAIFGERP